MIFRLVFAAVIGIGAVSAVAQSDRFLVGPAVYGDWRNDMPGLRRRITVSDMPSPYATPNAHQPPLIIARPEGVTPKAPPGFSVALFAGGFTGPRLGSVRA
jgi:hypothetical protein